MVLKTTGLQIKNRLYPFDINIKSGEFVGVIGPNGAGKTSFLQAALGLIKAQGHSSLWDYPVARRASHVAYLAQYNQLVWPILVRDLIALGSQSNPLAKPNHHALMDRLGLTPFADRLANQLSGGEQARVLLARALAQNTPLLIADEPCAALDPAQSLQTARLLRQEASSGRAVLASLHDLPLAARYCTRVLVLKDGHLLADGAPQDVLTPELMAKVFSIKFERLGDGWGLSELDRAFEPYPLSEPIEPCQIGSPKDDRGVE